MHDDEETDWLEFIMQTPEPTGSFPAVRFADISDWDRLVRGPVGRDLVEAEGRGHIGRPHDFGRIDPQSVSSSGRPGYLDTFLASLYLGALWAKTTWADSRASPRGSTAWCPAVAALGWPSGRDDRRRVRSRRGPEAFGRGGVRWRSTISCGSWPIEELSRRGR